MRFGLAMLFGALALTSCQQQPDTNELVERLEATIIEEGRIDLGNYERHYALFEEQEIENFFGIGDIPADKAIIGIYLSSQTPSRTVYGDSQEMIEVNHAPCVAIVEIGADGQFLHHPEVNCGEEDVSEDQKAR
ncbi:hypothetical protein [Aurantiacibacter sp. MUD61]|uniref:hypothetical protein n=1 Tax=Aurantiacibacter sp. MUD61 TaxID=3009083 RepID=UPI0022F011AE|nr:hypothetical protein [Aurantiacibacter sp. MUD61]